MRDAVADVLAQREREGASSLGPTVLVSLLLHAALFAVVVTGARRAEVPERVTQLNIRFASAPIARPGPPAAKPAEVKKEAVKPLETPKPVPPKVEPVKREAYAPKQESLFGKSEKPVAPSVPTPIPGSSISDEPADAPVNEGFALPGVGAAGVTGLEGGDFPYTIYVNQMLSKIGRSWARPQTSGELLAQVYFVIDRDGRVRDAKIERSSGSAAFDRAAIRSIIESSPLAPLPFGYSGTWLGVHLTFH